MPKSPLHCALAKWLYDWLQALHLVGLVVFQERSLRLADSEPEPDLSIVRGEADDFYTRHSTTAELVVEIAVSSVAADRAYASLYAEAGVGEYWIVLAEAQQVEVRRRPVNGVYQDVTVYGRNEELTCEAVEGISVPLSKLFPRQI